MPKLCVQRLKLCNSCQRLTSVSQVSAGLGLGERRHLVELGVDVRVFEVAEVDTFAVDDAVGQLLGQTLLRLLGKQEDRRNKCKFLTMRGFKHNVVQV